MKRLTFMLGITFLTFFVGVSLAICNPQTFNSSFTQPPLSEHIRLELRKLEKIENRYEVQFQVLNNSPETLRYQGYIKDDHCAFLVRRSAGSEEQVACFCGTGLAERTLHPGERATFAISLGEGLGNIKVGFDFLVGKARRMEVVWSEGLSLP